MSEASYGAVGRRVVLRALGEDPLDAIKHHLVLEEQPPPDPAALGPEDVVVAVQAAQINWVDLLMTSGQYQHRLEPPYTPGLEYSGVVAWVGDAVERVAVGDRVLSDGLLTGPRSKGSHQRWGGWASYAVAPQQALLPLPEPLGFDQGCSLLGNYETAYHCLIARGRLQAGETVLIHGASGSTGLAAVHLAKLVGATVIATGRSPDKLAVVAAQGADHVVSTAPGPDGEPARWRQGVKDLTGGAGVDVVYDGVGGAISVESLRCVTFGARFLIVGWAATPALDRANTLPTNLILMKGLDVLGCPTAITTHRDPSVRAERLERLLGWVREGRLRPHVGGAFPLERLQEGLRAKWRSQVVGGCVLRVR